MNSLSWMIYAADVVGNIQGLCVALLIFGGTGLLIVSGCLAADGEYEGRAAAMCNRGWCAIAVVALLATITPSTTTIYAIAASEMGEKAINTQTGGKAVQALNAWLDRQIKGETVKDD